MRRRPVLDGRLKDERGGRRDNRANADRFDRSENPQPGDFQANDGTGGNPDEAMFDSFAGQGIPVAPFPSDIPPPVLMPVPGAGSVFFSDLHFYSWVFFFLFFPFLSVSNLKYNFLFFFVLQAVGTFCPCSS